MYIKLDRDVEAILSGVAACILVYLLTYLQKTQIWRIEDFIRRIINHIRVESPRRLIIVWVSILLVLSLYFVDSYTLRELGKRLTPESLETRTILDILQDPILRNFLVLALMLATISYKYLSFKTERETLVEKIVQKYENPSDATTLEEIERTTERELDQQLAISPVHINGDINQPVTINIARSDIYQERALQLNLRRMQEFIAQLNRRSNLTLWAGLWIAVLSIMFLLWFTIQYRPIEHPNVTELLSYFIPKLSISVFTSALAYFLLGIYKNTLVEIKYFQNEWTNLESRHHALAIVLKSDTLSSQEKRDDLLKEVLLLLAKTERNFILNKGQSTVDLEKSRLEMQEWPSILNSVSSLVAQCNHSLSQAKGEATAISRPLK